MSKPHFATTTPSTRVTAARAAASPLEASIARAEAFLHDIAAKLAHVPLQGRDMDLHLRALAMKRDVARWRENAPDEASVRSVLELLSALDREAREALYTQAAVGLRKRT